MTRAFWKRLVLAAFVLAEGPAAASAATNVCSDLQARLDALSRSSTATSDAYRAYDAQASAQKAAVDRATNDARLNGCYGGFFSPKPSATCPQLLTTLNTAQTALAKVTATRDQYKADPYTLTSQRNDVLRLLQQNRCGNYATYAAPPTFGGGGFFASLFGGGYSSFGNGYYSNPTGYGSTYRTLCVRSGDGYYFPISFSTTADQFAADEATCRSMCPGADVSLYTHHNPGEEVDAMVSLKGVPYSSLPTAFKYRTTYDPSLSCGSPALTPEDQFTAQSAVLTPGTGTSAQNASLSIPSANATFTPLPLPAGLLVPTPSLRPAAAEDPETLADRAGRLVTAPYIAPIAPTVAGLTLDGRPIRIVGPTYYVAK